MSRVKDVILRGLHADRPDPATVTGGTLYHSTDTGQIERNNDARTAWESYQPGSAPPSGAAGGVLSGTYPNPGFASDMATQAELDAAIAANATADRARANHTGTQLAATISDFNTAVRTNRPEQLATPTGPLPMGAQKITGLADPTSAQDGATKAYVDNLMLGAAWKQSARAATTANGALATAYENGDTIDGVTLATGDRILLKNQTTGSENGIYTVNASGAPTRATDADSAADILQAAIFVREGTVNADTGWVLTTNAPITLGTTALTFAQLATSASVTAGSGIAIASGVVSIDIASLTEDTTPDSAADYVATYDASATAHKKVKLVNLPGSGGSTLPDLAAQDAMFRGAAYLLGTNHVGGATITSNGGGSSLGNMIDGNDGTASNSANHLPGVAHTIDLGSAVAIGAVRVLQEWAAGVKGAGEIKIESSPDNSTWTTRYQTTAGQFWGADATHLLGTANVSARYWRITGVTLTTGAASNGWNVYEIALYDVVTFPGEVEVLPPGLHRQILGKEGQPDRSAFFYPGDLPDLEKLDQGLYVLSNHNETDGTTQLHVWWSRDGKTFTEVAQAGVLAGRDFSIIRYRGRWLVCFTYTTGAFRVSASDDLKTWTTVATPSMTPRTGYTWAPEWFLDTDGSLHVFVATARNDSTSSSADMGIYEIHPTNEALTSWSAAVEVVVTGGPASLIDARVIRFQGRYLMLFKNEVSFNKYLLRAISDTLLGPYTQLGVTNATFFGSVSEVEGINIVRFGPTHYRIYYNTVLADGVKYVESYDDLATFGSEQSVSPSTFGHGTPILANDAALALALAPTASTNTEEVQDIIGAMVAAAGGTYDDAGGTITLPSGGTTAGAAGIAGQATATSYSLPFNAESSVTFDGSSLEAGLSWDVGDPTKLVCDVAGTYFFVGALEDASFDSARSGTFYIALRKNGATYLGPMASAGPTGNGYIGLTCTGGPVAMAAGDYVQLRAFQNVNNPNTVDGPVSPITATLGGFTFGGGGAPPPQGAILLATEARVVSGNAQVFNYVGSGSVPIPFAVEVYQDTTPAVGDQRDWSLVLAAGVYDFEAIGHTHPNRGIVKWQLDGADVITGQDWYAASEVHGVHKTGTITVPADGRHVLSMIVTGKNASATDRYVALNAVIFRNQAALTSVTGGSSGFAALAAVSRSTAQSIGNNQFSPYEKITFDTEIADNRAMANLGVDATIVTIAETGTYKAIGSGSFAYHSDSARRQLAIFNGTAMIGDPGEFIPNPNSVPTYCEVTRVFAGTAGDVISLRPYQNSGGGLNLTDARLTIERVN